MRQPWQQRQSIPVATDKVGAKKAPAPSAGETPVVISAKSAFDIPSIATPDEISNLKRGVALGRIHDGWWTSLMPGHVRPFYAFNQQIYDNVNGHGITAAAPLPLDILTFNVNPEEALIIKEIRVFALDAVFHELAPFQLMTRAQFAVRIDGHNASDFQSQEPNLVAKGVGAPSSAGGFSAPLSENILAAHGGSDLQTVMFLMDGKEMSISVYAAAGLFPAAGLSRFAAIVKGAVVDKQKLMGVGHAV